MFAKGWNKILIKAYFYKRCSHVFRKNVWQNSVHPGWESLRAFAYLIDMGGYQDLVARETAPVLRYLWPVTMVSMVAKTLKDKRQYNALVDIFQEADTSNDGRVRKCRTLLRFLYKEVSNTLVSSSLIFCFLLLSKSRIHAQRIYC